MTARKDVDPKLRDAFTRAFLELDPRNAEHAAVLALQGAKQFVPARRREVAWFRLAIRDRN